MADSRWQDRLAASRMRVDREFADRVRASTLTREQWSLVMTAVEFDVEHPEEPSRATLVADTSNLDAVAPELAAAADRRAVARPGAAGDDGDGLLDGLFDALGLGRLLGDDGSAEAVAEAERLAGEYAAELQDHLESRGEWTAICRLAAGDGAGGRHDDAGRDGDAAAGRRDDG